MDIFGREYIILYTTESKSASNSCYLIPKLNWETAIVEPNF